MNALDTLDNLLGAAVLVVAVHALEQGVVKALHANGESLDHIAQSLKALAVKVRRIGFAGNLFNGGEQLAHVIDGALELVHHNGRRAAANVGAGRSIAKVMDHLELAPQRFEVAARRLLAEGEACEGAIRAQHVAEWDVNVEQVLVPRLRRGQRAGALALRAEELTGSYANGFGK